jgi:hypothetical protein
MISIAANMDGFDIAQEIRLERQVHKGSFLLLEGQDDLDRFSKFIDSSCSTVNCFGRQNLIHAIGILYDEGFAGALGLADADFDRITNSLLEHEGIIYSERHDFDLDWACERVLARYLNEVGSADRCGASGGAKGVAEYLFQAVKPLSVMRFLNENQRLRYRLSRIRHHELVIDKRDPSIDVERLVSHVSVGSFSGHQKEQKLKDLIVAHTKRAFDRYQLTNGHDFLAMLGVALQKRIGDREIPQTWGSEIQLHFRLAYSEDDFVASSLFVAILAWQDANVPYVILKPSLISRSPEAAGPT